MKKPKANILFNRFLPIIILLMIGVILVKHRTSTRIQENFKKEVAQLEKLYSNKLYQESIDLSFELIEEYNKSKYSKGEIIKIRAASYFALKNYESALLNFNKLGGYKNRDYFVHYHKALLNDILKTHDTAVICYNLNLGINLKGFQLNHHIQDLNYVDSNNLWDINYLDMLILRVKYCERKDSLKTNLDKKLIKKHCLTSGHKTLRR